MTSAPRAERVIEFEDWMNIREAINLTDVCLLDFDLEVHCDGVNLQYELVPKGARPRTERISYDDVDNLSSDRRLAALEKGLRQEGRLPRMVMLKEANQDIDEFLARSFVGIKNDTYRELWVYVWSQARRMRNDMEVANFMKKRLLSKNLSQYKDLDSFFFPKRLESRWVVDLKDLTDFFFPSSIKGSCKIEVDSSIVCPSWLERPPKEFLRKNTQLSMTLEIKNGPTLTRWLHQKHAENAYENLELRKRWSRMDWSSASYEQYNPIKRTGCVAATEVPQEETITKVEVKEELQAEPVAEKEHLSEDDVRTEAHVEPLVAISSDSEEGKGEARKHTRLNSPSTWEEAIEAQGQNVRKWKTRIAANLQSFYFLIDKAESKVEGQLARIFKSPGGPRIQREVATNFLDGVRTVFERVAEEALEAGSENWILTPKGWIVNLAWRVRPRKRKKKNHRSRLSGGHTT